MLFYNGELGTEQLFANGSGSGPTLLSLQPLLSFKRGLVLEATAHALHTEGPRVSPQHRELEWFLGNR